MHTIAGDDVTVNRALPWTRSLSSSLTVQPSTATHLLSLMPGETPGARFRRARKNQQSPQRRSRGRHLYGHRRDCGRLLASIRSRTIRPKNCGSTRRICTSTQLRHGHLHEWNGQRRFYRDAADRRQQSHADRLRHESLGSGHDVVQQHVGRIHRGSIQRQPVADIAAGRDARVRIVARKNGGAAQSSGRRFILGHRGFTTDEQFKFGLGRHDAGGAVGVERSAGSVCVGETRTCSSMELAHLR